MKDEINPQHYKNRSIEVIDMKAPQSKTLNIYLSDPKRAREFFIIKRKAIRSGESRFNFRGKVYRIKPLKSN